MNSKIDKLQARIKAEKAKAKAQEKRTKERTQEALGRALIGCWQDSPEIIALLDKEVTGSARKLFGLDDKQDKQEPKKQRKISNLFRKEA